MNQKKINNIFGLHSKERYGYLLKKVAGFETIYLIDDWKNYTVIELSIHEFLKLLTDLEKENVDLAWFPNMEFKTIKISANEMKNHLLFELSQYE